MKLLYAPASPFVRKVMIALHETGLLDSVELLPVSITPVAPGEDVPAHNPLGKIPCLIRPNGAALYDSRVITRYLDSLSPKTTLYPEGDALWDALTLEATADGIMDAAVIMTYEPRLRPENMVFEPYVEAQWQKIDRALTVLEDRWMAHLNGPANMPVLAVAAALGYVDFRHDARNWRASHPVLAAWEADIAKRPSLAKTAPEA